MAFLGNDTTSSRVDKSLTCWCRHRMRQSSCEMVCPISLLGLFESWWAIEQPGCPFFLVNDEQMSDRLGLSNNQLQKFNSRDNSDTSWCLVYHLVWGSSTVIIPCCFETSFVHDLWEVFLQDVLEFDHCFGNLTQKWRIEFFSAISVAKNPGWPLYIYYIYFFYIYSYISYIHIYHLCFLKETKHPLKTMSFRQPKHKSPKGYA